MSEFQYITLILCAIGSPIIGFLFGASWGYVQAIRQEVDTFSLVLCVIACGSFFCLLGFLATMVSLFFLR